MKSLTIPLNLLHLQFKQIINHTIIYTHYCVHIQTPPTSYVGLILRSTTVATASRSTVQGTMRVL